MNIVHTYLSDRRGIATTEAALMLPFFAVLCFATIDTSYLLLQSHKMESGLSAAGSYLARTNDPESYAPKAKRLAVTGQLATGGTPVIKNWTESDITLGYKKITNTPTQDGMSYRGAATVDIIQLSSEFEYEGLGFINNMMGGRLKVKASYEERLIGGSG